MAITVEKLADLDSTVVEQNRLLYKQLLAELLPDLNTKRGAITDLVIEPEAILATACDTLVDNLLTATTLSGVQTAGEEADDELVDSLASNYFITRDEGSKATGSLLIVLDSLISVVIPIGTIFTAGGKNYLCTQAFIGQTSESLIINTTVDRLVTALGDDKYGFVIEVEAEAVGSSYNVEKGTEFETETVISALEEIIAESDFEGGSDAQTNEDLVNSILSGLAVGTFTNNYSFLSMLTKSGNTGFEDIRAVSLVGAGDVEMLRDKHGLFPASQGGMVDAYVRTAARPANVTVEKTATLISKDGAIGTWTLQLDATDAPGFYEIISIYPSGRPLALSGVVTADSRGISGEIGSIPSITNITEAVYTAYQTAAITFIDPETDASDLDILDEADYTVVLQCMPLIAEIQEFVNDPDYRDPTLDILIKAAIPCEVSVNVTLSGDTTTVDEDAIIDAIVTYINSLGFTDKLFSSNILLTIQALVPSWVDIEEIELEGAIRSPVGNTFNITSSSVLELPDGDEEHMISAKTTIFSVSAENVTIETL